jgi:stage II sporulation protein D
MSTNASIRKWVVTVPLATQRAVTIGLVAFLSIAVLVVWVRKDHSNHSIFTIDSAFERRLDETLHQAATSALQQREGTIIVIDPQSGRIRTIVNSETAVENAFAPGSTLKPFVTIAAMRAGLIDKDSRTLCRQEYSHRDFKTVCSHPAHLAPLNPADAIAYSCNFYFARLGERMDERVLNPVLLQFGFGSPSEGNFDHESSGKLIKAEWQPENALGDGQYVQVTPVQLLMAYSALVNGGHLLIPTVADAQSFTAHTRAEISIANDEHDVIIDGMRGAVVFGTAERAGLASLPLYIIGKTGTATPSKGFRSQGWFVGFAAEQQNQFVNPKLGVLVFLKKGHGFDAAQISRSIFESYANSLSGKIANQISDSANSGSQPNSDPSVVRVHFERENVTRTMSLESYVQSVVAVEGSLETKLEGLKALAVVTRTYATKNLGRHAAEGFDFCNMTHCQRTAPEVQISELVRRAVRETQGEVLRDNSGAIAQSYFSASCGGQTANIAKLWNAPPEPYLRGVRDEFCVNTSHSHWIDVITASDMLRAIQSDPRTDVGDELREIVVRRRDESGRAELISIAGRKHRMVNGWDFKIIVGRALGWNHLKSSRFEISRSGADFVFRGSGFGHGLGLCQEGAHVMAERGSDYRQILMKYFPGVSIGTIGKDKSMAGDLLWSQTESSQPRLAHTRSAARRQLSSPNFRVSYPVESNSTDAEHLLQLLEANRTALLNRPRLPSGVRLPFIEVFVNQTTGDFVGRTGLPSWAAAASSGNRIELQPLELLQRRRILETTLRHELVHKLVDSAGNGHSPRWLAEGLALYIAGEGPMLARYIPARRMALSELEEKLREPANGNEMRELYALAFIEVRELIKSKGEAATWKLVSQKQP